MSVEKPVLEVRNLDVTFRKGRQSVSAVAGISFDLYEGETLGLVGESGCGKSTTGKALMQIVEPTGGQIIVEGRDLMSLDRKEARRLRTRMQMIFQDPVSSLNPRRRVKDIVAEPLDCWKTAKGAEREEIVNSILNQVGIDPAVYGNRYARQFSGGQCQRISIARSLAMRPGVLICDEVVSALDVSIQAQILNLLEDLKKEYGLTMLFIAHDLAVVKHIATRVAVMYLGKIVEAGPAAELFADPRHPYTRALISAIPQADPEKRIGRLRLGGEPRSPIDPDPNVCRFYGRCPKGDQSCANTMPPLREAGPARQVACHFA